MTDINHPKISAFYRHVDGGLYFVRAIGISTVDQTHHVVYDHIYPFSAQQWIRPLREWTDVRFQLLTQTQAADILSLDRDTLQQEISSNKAARRKQLV